MNHEEALNYILNVPWEVKECFSGPKCWCRIVVPKEKIAYVYELGDGTFQEEMLDEIIGAAAIDQKTAEYIVEIHNKNVLEKFRFELAE